ncbi:ANKHD1, partial [Symbiodinium microadriaticum]
RRGSVSDAMSRATIYANNAGRVLSPTGMVQHPKTAAQQLLHVWLVSGEKLASLCEEQVTDVLSLKRHLQTVCGKSRFRQRLLHHGTPLADNVKLCSFITDIQLVLLPFVHLTRDQETSLQEALLDGQLKSVEDMLLLPADPDVSLGLRNRDNSWLRLAAYNGHEEIVRLLLEAGSVPYADALCTACSNGHVEIVSVLLGAGAGKDQVWAQGTPLTWAAAGDSGRHLEIVGMLLEARADLHKMDGALHTPLTSAVAFGYAELVHFLLAARADTSTLCSESQQTPLCIAAQEGCVECVRLLLEAGADIEGISARRTPLTSAVAAGEAEIVQKLIGDGASVDKVDDELYTPLTRALRGDDTHLVHLLLLGRADADMICPYTGKSPLCMASGTGRMEMVALLLLARADKDKGSAEGTPLTLAAGAGHLGVVRLLIMAGAQLDKQAVTSIREEERTKPGLYMSGAAQLCLASLRTFGWPSAAN